MIRYALTLTCALTLLSACSADPLEPAIKTVATPDYDTAPLDLSTPENTAYSMMIAMYRGDAEMVDAIFAEGGTLLRLNSEGEITRDGLPRWREWVGTLEVGYAHEELFEIKVEKYGKLSSVWAPFVIDVDGKRVGCGVNHFTMAEMPEGWRIVSGMDVQAPKEDCSGFRDSYRGGT
ncbi:MAG: hypothetical protein ABJO36_02220 [Litorimonas sp.]